MKAALLFLLPLFFSFPGQHQLSKVQFGQLPADHPRKAGATPSSAEKNLWGEWVKLKGDLDCVGLTFYPGGLLNLHSESRTLSTAYKITSQNTVPVQELILRGQIIRSRSNKQSPKTPFTIRFLSPSEIEITLLFEQKDDIKATLKKKRSIRPGAKLIR